MKKSVVIFVLLLSGVGFAQTAPLARARESLFVNSDLEAARAGAATVLAGNPTDREALFITMEAAALQADTRAELDAALRLCETASDDPRVTIAAARIRDLAANTTEFRGIVPRIRALIARGTSETRYLRAALLAAAADGMPGISLLDQARDAGLITDWRMAGPFGRYSNVDFDRRWPAEQDGLAQPTYAGRAVERFRFEDGNITVPGYFERAGVFYAASEVAAANAGAWLVRVESPGTLAVFVDGAPVLTKDERFREAPQVASCRLKLTAGTHRMLVKFVPAGTPFRVALMPDRQPRQPVSPIAFAPEARYVAAAVQYWSGDYASAIGVLRSQETAVARYLLAKSWSRTEQDSPEEPALLEATLNLAPGALAAEYDLAARAYSYDHTDDALTRLQRVPAARPEFVPAQELMSQIAVRLNWRAEATQATEARLRLHPSCAALRDAAHFYSATAQFSKAEQAEARLQDCMPGSLAYAEMYSEAGRHAEAAQALATEVAEHPFNREARALLTKELALAGETEAARKAARDLVTLAPNADEYRRLAVAVESVGMMDDLPRAGDFAAGGFYAPYRRNAFQALKEITPPSFSNGNAIMLLSDRVARLGPDGSVAVYVHRLTLVLNRDGIERYGEVALPADADVLELRTIKPDGATAEPELTRHKATISMPALAPGDIIEQEYVERLRDGSYEGEPAMQFTFGAFGTPTLRSRFVVLWPTIHRAKMQVVSSGAIPKPQTFAAGEMTATIWEQNDIPQFFAEGSMPPANGLPNVRIVQATSWSQVRDHYREAVIEAMRVGARVEEVIASLRGRTDEQKARELYRAIARLRSVGSWIGSGEAVSAEATLAAHSGSRTVTLLALARAAGLHADLLLARDTGSLRPEVAQLGAYIYPLVRFDFEGHEIVVDAETEGMAFGALKPTLERGDALLVPIEPDSKDVAQNAIVALPDTFANEQSVAESDVSLDDSGALAARVTIRMGTTRAAQMRSILAGIEPGQRQHFFEQLALRIFPGMGTASGEVRNEYDLEHSLEIVLFCRAPHFVNLSGGLDDMDELVPALGLRKMYGAGYRRFPLYVDAPLFETATFRLRLPPHATLARRPANVQLKTEFGEYAVNFRELRKGEWEIRRAFRVPVQVIAPERFPAFSRFALQIEDAERQRLTLQRDVSFRSSAQR